MSKGGKTTIASPFLLNLKAKKMKTIINLLIMLSIVVFTCSCGYSKSIEGEIKEVRGDTACLKNHCFKLLPNAPKTKIGNRAVFMNVKKTDKRINCTIIK